MQNLVNTLKNCWKLCYRGDKTMELLLFQSLWACGAEFSAYRRFMSL